MKVLLISGVMIAGIITYQSFANKPAAKTYDYAWLAGSWEGDGFGGTSEETWSTPSEDGTMMGMYRHFKADGSLNFYEFMLLDETGLRLKHFSPTMEGWETKEDYLHFKAIKLTKDKIELEGLTFEKKSDNETEIRLKMKSNDGFKTEVFKMMRKK
ncbi:MAG: DUF6265 family protein [Bacteroidota bacterium]